MAFASSAGYGTTISYIVIHSTTEMACHLKEDNHSIFRFSLSLTGQMQGNPSTRVGDVERGS